MAASVLWAPRCGMVVLYWSSLLAYRGGALFSYRQGPKLGFGCLWVLDLIQQSRPAGQDDSFSLQFMVYEVPGQDLEVDLYDEDTDRDDFLGR